MEHSPRLNIPYLAPSQAQKHVTHNEALRLLDCLVHLTLKDKDLTTPPADPAEGDCYFVAAPAGDAWTGQENQLACFQDGAWMFYQPQSGFVAWLADQQDFMVWSDNTWNPISTASQQAMLGINTSADALNRLAVKSDAVLLDHQGEGTQLKLNKASSDKVNAILLQTAYSGRAEIGTLGNDDLQLKTSGDGQHWTTAMTASAETGRVMFPATSELVQTPRFNLFPDGGRMAGTPEPNALTVGPFQAPAYILSSNGSLLSEGPAFKHNNSTHGGSGSALDPAIDALISSMRPGGGTALRYGPEFYSLAVTAGNDTTWPLAHNGTTYYSSLRNSTNPLPPQVSMGYWISVSSGQILIHSVSTNLVYLDATMQQGPVELTATDGWHHIYRIIDRDAANYVGYYSNMFKVYATPGSQYRIAAPFLFFGHVSPNSLYTGGCIPSASAW